MSDASVQYLVTEAGEGLETDLGAFLIMEEQGPIWTEQSAALVAWVEQ